jgi:hypothetical protein
MWHIRIIWNTAEENRNKIVLAGESRRHVAHQDHLESGYAEENRHKIVLDGESRRHMVHQGSRIIWNPARLRKIDIK